MGDRVQIDRPRRCIERSFRTDGDEICHVRDLRADFDGIETALLAWNHRYESRRLHQALDYLTPNSSTNNGPTTT